MIIVEQNGTILRQARTEDMPRIDEITITCYQAIHESFVSLLGQDVYKGVYHEPNRTWKEKKLGQVHDLFEEHPEWVWVLELTGNIIGYVTFKLFPEKKFGQIENNGVVPEHTGKGWGKFMYRYVFQYFRDQGLRFAHVETDLDEPHIPARQAYEAVGFDREVRIVLYWQDLSKKNPGSVLD